MRTRAQQNAESAKAAAAKKKQGGLSKPLGKRTATTTTRCKKPVAEDQTVDCSPRRVTRRKSTGKKQPSRARLEPDEEEEYSQDESTSRSPSPMTQKKRTPRRRPTHKPKKNKKVVEEVEDVSDESEEEEYEEMEDCTSDGFAPEESSPARPTIKSEPKQRHARGAKKKAVAEDAEYASDGSGSESSSVQQKKRTPQRRRRTRNTKQKTKAAVEEEDEEMEEDTNGSVVPKVSSTRRAAKREHKPRLPRKAKKEATVEEESGRYIGTSRPRKSKKKAVAEDEYDGEKPAVSSALTLRKRKPVGARRMSKSKPTAKKRNRGDYNELVETKFTAKKSRRKAPPVEAEERNVASAAAANALALLPSSPVRAPKKKRQNALLVHGELFEPLDDPDLRRIIQFTIMPSQIDDSLEKAAEIAKSALTLLTMEGTLAVAAFDEFSKEITDTDAQPTDGPGLRLSSKHASDDVLIDILGSLPTVEKFSIMRREKTLSNEYLLALTSCTIRELHLAVDEENFDKVLKATKRTVKKLSVVVQPLNHLVVTALSDHGKRLEELSLKFVNYNIYFSHTLLKVGVAMKKSLRRFDVVGKLMAGRTARFLDLDKVKKLIPECNITFNGDAITHAVK